MGGVSFFRFFMRVGGACAAVKNDTAGLICRVSVAAEWAGGAEAAERRRRRRALFVDGLLMFHWCSRTILRCERAARSSGGGGMGGLGDAWGSQPVLGRRTFRPGDGPALLHAQFLPIRPEFSTFISPYFSPRARKTMPQSRPGHE
jgi:hypothetical protein